MISYNSELNIECQWLFFPGSQTNIEKCLPDSFKCFFVKKRKPLALSTCGQTVGILLKENRYPKLQPVLVG